MGWRMLAVFVFAVLVRLAFAAHSGGLALRVDQLDADSPSYFELGSRLAEHGDFMSTDWNREPVGPRDVQPTALRAPLWPVVQAIPYSIFGATPTAGRILNIGLDSLACALLVAAGARLHSVRAGVLAGTAGALWPQFIASTRQVMSDSLFTLLVVILLIVLDRHREHSSVRSGIEIGLVLGLITLARPNGFAVACAIFLWLGWRAWRRGATARPLLAVGLTAAILVIPYVGYASARFKSFVPVTTEFGVVVGGVFTDNTVNRHHPTWGWWDVGPVDAARLASHGDIEWSEKATRAATDWIGVHPRGSVRVLAYHVLRYFDLYWEIGARQQTLITDPGRLLTVGTPIAWWLTAVLAAFGLRRVVRARDTIRWEPTFVLFVTFMVSGLLVLAGSRYRMPAEPGVILLAATMVASL